MGRKIIVLPHWKAHDYLRCLQGLPTQDSIIRERVGADRSPALCSDINWVIMDYLVSEGYPGAAEKFAQETNLPSPVDNDSIRERVQIRNAIHAGRVDEAIEMVNEIDPEVSPSASLPLLPST